MRVEEYTVTCIVCPRGCRVKVSVEDGVVKKIEGFQCPLGREYALKEIYEPVRTLITVVACRGGDLPVVSVKTDKPIPRERLIEASRFLKNIVVEAPVRIGDVIVEDLMGLGVRVVATRPCLPKEG